jgi:hypothetical protein
MSHQNVVRSCAAARRRSTVTSTAILIALFGVLASSAGAETAGETFPVSVTADGAYADGEGTGEFAPLSISADGRYVAFESAAANLGEEGPAGAYEGFVKDLGSGAVRLVSRADGPGGAPAGEPGVGDLELSADGRYAIFTSAATNLGIVLPGEAPSERHVYRRDLQTGETALVDRVSGTEGAILSRGAEAAAISADGRYVAFTTHVENLEDPLGDHAETANAVGYVRDMQTGVTTAVSRAGGTAGEMADKSAEWLSISADGRYAAFSSLATNLVPGVEEGVWEQVYLRDLQTSTTSLVSQNALGEAGDRSSGLPVLSGADGCKVAFSSIAFNLLKPSPLEISGEQVYVADHCASPPTMTLVSQDANGIAPFSYTLAGGSADGRYAIFVAEFAGSPCCHLYLRDLVAEQTSQLDRASGVSGAPANQSAETFAISANGCRVVFTTQATNLYGAGPPEGPSGEKPWEVYARQLAPCVESPEEPGATAPPGKGSSVPAAPTDLKIAGLGLRKLTLSLSGPGRVSVRVRRFVEEPRRHWKFLRTIAAEADAGGQVEVLLPSFPAGRYRLNVHLHGSDGGLVRMLVVGPRQPRV